GLLLWRVTGGPFAAERLADNYYSQYIRVAEKGGMAAVAETEHFRERILANPRNRQLLNAISTEDFIAVMKRWRDYFFEGADLPVIGASKHDLNTIRAPACIIPGNDKTHSHITGNAAHAGIKTSELHDLWPGDLDIDLFPAEDWATRETEQAAIFTDFLQRKGLSA
ncbi:MAG: hypothetical protein JO254_09760, partial [Pseudolabrys sp.]|nr:hypothetical protein [Pseudolabrys sp.]